MPTTGLTQQSQPLTTGPLRVACYRSSCSVSCRSALLEYRVGVVRSQSCAPPLGCATVQRRNTFRITSSELGRIETPGR